MRTIHLRQDEHGNWFVSVTLLRGSAHSHHAYESRAQARRAFVIEGRHQPYARMLIHLDGAARAIVIREGRRAVSIGEAGIVDLEAVKAALNLSRSPERMTVTDQAPMRPGPFRTESLVPSDHA